MKRVGKKCFTATLTEVRKYGLSAQGQLKRNPMAWVVFPEYSINHLMLKVLEKIKYRIEKLIKKIKERRCY